MNPKKMTWNCINCESANEVSTMYCDVCGYERYFSINEVNDMIAFQQDSPSDAKKAEANFKRASTENKKLRDKNKELITEMQELRQFYNTYSDDAEKINTEINWLRKNNLRLKIWLTIAGLVILFFVFAKVTLHISF